MPGVYIRTFGCQMNEYDSAKLYRLLERSYRPVDSPEKASLILINTCSVREKPELKLYSLLGEYRQLKERNKQLLIGVGGCVAQQEGQAIVRRSKAVDFVFGTHNLSLVPALITSRLAGAAPQVAVDYREDWEELPPGFSDLDRERNRIAVFVSISRGCNKNCSFCIVPRTRGPEASRDPDEILREIRLCCRAGAREVILLGQNVNSYGRDFRQRLRFTDLLARISEIEELKRIRFTSPHPQEVREDFIQAVAENPRICRHIHMPLQSGSDRILKAMNRNYRSGRYLEIIASLKERVPDMAITTDIIVGFPGESEEDFKQTMDILEQVRFESSFSFVFSPRPGTPAAAMQDGIPEAEKLRRLQVLQARQQEISAEKLKAWVGREAEVLLEGSSSADARCLQGRTSQNIVLNLECEHPQAVAGAIIPALVTGAGRHTLRGRLAPAPQGLA